MVNNNWVLVNEIKQTKTVYNFFADNLLTISTDGAVAQAKWHYVNP
ncbi:hypothetical protein N7U66_03075 [Lacinutrix neustonica]|uniref:Uncharacterized protein n=1 Tax=Lacinutrix neustonica TaxID=2980107 RepID=A0A9E8MWB5_9FLAO|nr:hypothetical protein [Lacinutrix neustonica]WAC02678.1 hypothetical protein N7U66_03075 [Lacinutrix neustonica]